MVRGLDVSVGAEAVCS
jgi:hypothetical protein